VRRGVRRGVKRGGRRLRARSGFWQAREEQLAAKEAALEERWRSRRAHSPHDAPHSSPPAAGASRTMDLAVAVGTSHTMDLSLAVGAPPPWPLLLLPRPLPLRAP